MERRQSIQHKLDLTWGLLLVFVIVSGSLALWLAQKQRFDAVIVGAVNQQQIQVLELTQKSSRILNSALQGETISAEEQAALIDSIAQVDENLKAIESGGQIAIGQDREVGIPYIRDAMVRRNMDGVLLLWGPVRDALSQSAETQLNLLDHAAIYVMHEQLEQNSQALLELLSGLSANLERWAVGRVMQLTKAQFLIMALAIIFFFLGLWVLRRNLIRPLQQMAHGIDSMRRSGRLVKVPSGRNDEFGLVAGEFNRLTDQIEHQKKRLRAHVEELQRINVELEHLSAVKDDFLSTVSHQLRTPLTAIMEGVSLLHDGTLGELTEQQHKYLQIATENADHLNDLIENLLDLSKLRSGQRRLYRKADNLDSLLREVAKEWEGKADGRVIRCELESLESIFMDRQAIREVTDHLMSNAMKHIPEEGQITLRARIRDGLAEISVADTGLGIPQEKVEKLFQPFVHLEQPEAPGTLGTGLGLAICKQIIERHRGWIRAESAEGRGSNFTFAIPVANEEFYFKEACLNCQAEAERTSGAFGVIAIVPKIGSTDETQLTIERTVRINAHPGDVVVRFGPSMIVLVALADRSGIVAITERVSRLLKEQGFSAEFGSAAFPNDSTEPMALLEKAKQRIKVATEAQPTTA